MRPYLTTRQGFLFGIDCLEVARNIRSDSVDCVFADPPFNLGKDYKNGFRDRVNEAEYFEWSKEWIFECTRILKPGGAFFLYALPELAVKFAGYMNERLTFRHWIALSMKGSYPRGRKLYPAHYSLLYYARGNPKTFNKIRLPVPSCRHCNKELKDYGGHRDKLNPAGLNLTDFWEDTSPNRHRKFKVRPGVNELKLVIPERAILLSTNPGDVVFDPFGGGGSTFQAAEKHDRFWIGAEIFDCHHIAKRLEEFFPFSLGRAPDILPQCLFLKYEDNPHQVLWRREGKDLQTRIS
jgi:site-specific DNA-methyltransferase (adenine-specific)